MFDLIIFIDKILKTNETKPWHQLSGCPWFVSLKNRQKTKPDLNPSCCYADRPLSNEALTLNSGF